MKASTSIGAAFEHASTVGLAELASACAMQPDELLELVEYGALHPVSALELEPAFPVSCLDALRTAGKLRRDYDLDLFVVVIVMDYLRRITDLEVRIASLQASSLRGMPDSEDHDA